jgi:hypothetical protein
MPPRYPSYDDDLTYGTPRTRQSRGYPTIEPPAPVYTPKSRQETYGLHQNILKRHDDMIAREADPTRKAAIAAQREEMNAAWLEGRPYPDFAARALEQQAMGTHANIAGAAVAANTIKAQAPVAAANVRGQYQVEAKRVEGDVRKEVASTNADAKKYGADASARAREISARIKAATSVGGAMPSPEDQAWLKNYVQNGGTVAPTAQAAPTPQAPQTPTTRPATTQSVASTATNTFPAQGTEEEAPSVPMPSLTPPTIPEARAAEYQNPYQTTPREPAPRPAPVTGDAADPKSTSGIKFDAGDYGRSPQESKSAKQAQAEPEFSDTDRAAYQAYRQSSGDRSISMRAFLSGPYKQYQQANKADAARYDAERAPSLAQVTNTARRDSADNLAGIKTAMASFPTANPQRPAPSPQPAPAAVAQTPRPAMPTVNPPAPMIAQRVAPPPTLISGPQVAYAEEYPGLGTPAPAAPVATTQPTAPVVSPRQVTTQPRAVASLGNIVRQRSTGKMFQLNPATGLYRELVNGVPTGPEIKLR